MRPEPRRRGRPPRGDAPATGEIRIRVTPAEVARLRLVALRSQTSVSDFCRLVINMAAEEAGEPAPLSRHA